MHAGLTPQRWHTISGLGAFNVHIIVNVMFQGLNALIWLSYSYFYLFDPAKLLLSHGVTYDLASKEGKLAVAFMKSMGKTCDPAGFTTSRSCGRCGDVHGGYEAAGRCVGEELEDEGGGTAG